MVEKKIIIFNDKMFYNARHLYNHLKNNYSSIHKVTYDQVEKATGKRLQSIDKFFKVGYDMVSASMKKNIKRYVQISEGYEEIVAFETKKFDDFIIKYLGIKNVAHMLIYRNVRDEVMLAYKLPSLTRLAKIYNEQLHDLFVDKILKESYKKDGFYYYKLEPSTIKQNIF